MTKDDYIVMRDEMVEKYSSIPLADLKKVATDCADWAWELAQIEVDGLKAQLHHANTAIHKSNQTKAELKNKLTETLKALEQNKDSSVGNSINYRREHEANTVLKARLEIATESLRYAASRMSFIHYLVSELLQPEKTGAGGDVTGRMVVEELDRHFRAFEELTEQLLREALDERSK